ncbi:MAG TPA: sulfatase-like hydrolase/transferase [Myxococcota bacterium]|nr:sulfatase-like hydrolase/transferase [Myxococcota bacterium]
MWLLILGCGGSPVGPEVDSQEPERAQNVLVVVFDDVGVDKVSSYADDFPEYEPEYLPNTQTFDQVGAAGVRFTEVWSAPLCSPTRASILTGVHPYRHGVGTVVPQGPPLSTDAVTLPELVPETHTTGLFGKWHLGISGLDTDAVPHPEWDAEADGHTREDPGSIKHTLNPIQQGWDHYAGGLSGTVCTMVLDGDCVGGYDHWILTRGSAETPGVTKLWWEDGYATEVEVDDALAWIREQEGPWVTMLAFHAPHQPSHGTARFGCQRTTVLPSPRPNRVALYVGMLECADTHLERMLWELDAMGELDDTLLVVAGDNGVETFLRESIMGADRTIKGTAYESSVHVPLAISTGASWASVASGGEPLESDHVALPGRTVDQMVHTTDLFATVLEWVGGDRSGGVDSLSLAPLLRGPSVEMPRDFLYTERFIPSDDFGLLGLAAIRDPEGNKLVADVHPEEEALCRELQLFEDGPVDLLDRYGDAELAEVQETLEGELAARIEDGAAWLDHPPCP